MEELTLGSPRDLCRAGRPIAEDDAGWTQRVPRWSELFIVNASRPLADTQPDSKQGWQGQAAKMLDGLCEGRPGCSEAAAQLVKGSSG